MDTVRSRAGELIQHWRHARELSQAALAFAAGTSPRNLSVIENRRSVPSEALAERLGEALELSPVEQDLLRLSAGHGRAEPTSDLEAGARLAESPALESLLDQLWAFPVLVMDRQLAVLRLNITCARLLSDSKVDPDRFESDRASWVELVLRSDGLRPALSNWEEVAYALLHRVYREMAMSDPDGALSECFEALLGIEGVPSAWRVPASGDANRPIRMVFRDARRTVTLDELVLSVGSAELAVCPSVRVHAFVPADEASRRHVAELAEGGAAAARRSRGAHSALDLMTGKATEAEEEAGESAPVRRAV